MVALMVASFEATRRSRRLGDKRNGSVARGRMLRVHTMISAENMSREKANISKKEGRKSNISERVVSVL